MLLTDGTVYTDNGNGECCRLTPDIHGSYRNGTWARLSSMNYGRLFFASQVLTNGNVFVAGGEYGTGRRHAELFDPLNNVWTKIPDPVPGPAFSDAISETLPNGNVLVAPVSQFGGCEIYNVAANTWQAAASTANQNEVAWTKMPNDTIVTIDTGTQTSEHYVPALNQWKADGTVPVAVYGFGAELGGGFLLPNGKAFYIGGSTNTAIYTPNASPLGAGTWVAGPPMVFGTNNLGAVDAPAAMLVNGKILCDIGPVGGFNGPASFYEYDYVANAFTQVTAPGGGLTYGSAPFVHSMLCLPDGTLLFVGGQNSTSLYIYTPDGTPLPAGQPTINNITENADGSFHLIGLGLNGISEGAAYGDDEQMATAYPLVRMTNTVSGNVYYARTRNWSSTSVQTGSRVITTEFNLPQSLPTGTYSLVVAANGNPSVATNFTYSPPPVPAGLTAVSGSNGFARMSWNSSSGATAYNLKRSAINTGYFTTIATVSGTTYTNVGLTNGLTYYYKVAAVGPNGPSSDSSAVSAKPAGPPTIPGATSVTLASYYNRIGFYTDGIHFSGGLDNAATAYSANLLGTSVFWNGLVFGLGPANSSDVISCLGQTITLPQGQFNSLQLLATGVQGSQTNTFTVTYTDNSTATFTQSFSDWANQQFLPGETSAATMQYRNQGTGTAQILKVSVDGYSFLLDPTKTVESITVPNNSNIILLSMVLANETVSADLTSFYNRAGIYTDGTSYTNPATGGIDGGGYSYSGTLLGSSQTWTNTLFLFGPLNATNVISCTNQTIPLPQGTYSRMRFLGSGVNGSQAGQTVTVTYTDATTSTFSGQGFSDWFSPQNYARESKAIPMSYRNSSDGSSTENNALYLYGYDFPLVSTKTVQSVRLPNAPNVMIAAITLVPDWPPTFKVDPLTLPQANSGVSYSGTIATNASDLNSDTLTYAKVSGPAWLNVAANGTLFGPPADSDVGTNIFVLSVKDTSGLSNTMTLYINVNVAPSFTVTPFSLPGIATGLDYSGEIDTNATDPNPGDVLTFAKVSGAAWLTVSADGQLSGTPLPGDAGDNTFVVSVTDSGGLTATATMDIVVSASTPFVSSITPQSDGTLQLNWSGGTGPFQVQVTTNLIAPDWQNIGDPVSGNSIFVTPTNDTMFYRIIGQ
jgi:hypothetical protein